MKVSLDWLRDFVDVDVDVDKLLELLSFSGLKVESVTRGRDVSGVVVAEVVSVVDHPHADKLTLVEVKTSESSTQRVVCGARNMKAGDRVPLAPPGAHVAGMTIERRKIRGEVSDGMLCSAAELDLSEDHSGILILAAGTELGGDVGSILGLDDTVIELEITPNRADCMGMIGIAREVGALVGGELRMPSASPPEFDDVSAGVSVEIHDPDGCPRYFARFIDAVTTGPAPTWMTARLASVGLRPINNIVDITNYVMHETGQPLHAFDADKIATRSIVVRRARADEQLTTLDGVIRRLDERDLVIADPEGAIALAGVMGGSDSEVSAATSGVILEAASFDKASVSFTSRRHSLRSEASARFERGCDPDMPPLASARAAQLMAELAGGRVASEAVDAFPRPPEPVVVTLRPQRTDAVLGVETAPEVQAQRLRSLGLDVATGGEALEATIPTWRRDLTREIDLIEEVARLEGLDRLPASFPPGLRGGLEPDQAADMALRRTLAAAGLFEAWTPAFMPERALDLLLLPDDDPARSSVRLSNPMTEDERLLRTTLLPGLLRSLRRNFAYGADGVGLFEVARTYHLGAGELPDERGVVTAVAGGVRPGRSWRRGAEQWDFFALKGVLEGLFASLRLPPSSFAPGAPVPWHPTRTALVALNGDAVGFVGELHPDVCARFEVPERTVAFELATTPLFEALGGRPKVGELPRLPPMYLDLAVVVDDTVPAATVERVIRAAGAPEVTSVRLFDLYRGDQVAGGRKSLAYALELRSPERTLTDQEAETVRNRITSALRERVGGELRS
jgi:phenylalanyl-tRNA synthetase beta chain